MDLNRLQTDVLCALEEVKRPGMDNLLAWIKGESDFFTAPASTMFHGNYVGGLIEHSWNVFDLLVKKNDQFNTMFMFDTLAICGLLHDLCKANFYVKKIEEPTDAQMKYFSTLVRGRKFVAKGELNKEYISALINYFKNGGDEPDYIDGKYQVEDQFPIGHGEKSVILINRFIPLSDAEALAIRWHLASFDAGIHYNFPSGFPFRGAIEKHKLVTLLITADMEASNILEAKNAS